MSEAPNAPARRVSDPNAQNSPTGETPTPLPQRAVALALEVIGIPGSGLLTLKNYRPAAAHLAITVLAGAALVVAALRGSVPMLWVSGGILVIRPLVAAVQCVRATGEGMKWSYVASVGIVSLMSFQLRPELVRQHWVEAFKIPSAAMVPGIGVDDQVFVAKGRTPVAGDIVVYRSGPKKLPYAKRVVAVGPATVRVQGAQVSVDGKALEQKNTAAPCPLESECSVLQETAGSQSYRVLHQAKTEAETAEAKLGPGELYVLGDNRDASHDSRHHGPVSLDQVVGVMTMVWWEGD